MGSYMNQDGTVVDTDTGDVYDANGNLISAGVAGSNLSLASVVPNPAVNQGVSGSDGGASGVMDIINSIGRWGSVITSQVSGRPVATTPGGIPVGAPGSGPAAAAGVVAPNGLIWLLAFGAIILLLVRK